MPHEDLTFKIKEEINVCLLVCFCFLKDQDQILTKTTVMDGQQKSKKQYSTTFRIITEPKCHEVTALYK